MLFSKLAQITDGDLHQSEEQKIDGFFTDTRNLSGRENEVFIAIIANRDGHQFIADALQKGTKNFIVQEKINEQVNQLIVTDTTKAFQQIAAHHRGKFNLPVVVVAGSNGKTTVKEWLWVLLSQQFFTLKNPKSYNSQIGAPHAVLGLRKGHEMAIFEAGISTIGEMEKLEKIIQPTFGIFTNLGEAHNEGFANKEEKLKEKLQLFTHCKRLVSNHSYKKSIRKYLPTIELITWSFTDKSASYFAKFEQQTLSLNDIQFKISLSQPTDLENVINAIITSILTGVNLEKIQKGLNEIHPIPMRLEFKKGINGCYLLDDTYNNDLEGLKVALEYSQGHHQGLKRTIILSDIYQSGIDSDKLYQEVARILEEKNINRIIGIGEQITAFEDYFKIEKSFFQTTTDLLNSPPHFSDEMIVIKGARHFRLEKIVQQIVNQKHGTILEVSFDALRHNLNQYRNLILPKTKLMAMVKANAYGMGILEVGSLLQNQKVDYLGVAYVDEAVSLRKNGISLPIMIMNPFIESYAEFEKYELEAEIFSLFDFKRMLQDTVIPPKIHLKIDTGMHRLGFSPNQIPELIAFLKENQQVEIAGIFTHFSSSDNPKEDHFTQNQAKLFDEIYDQITNAIGYLPTKHACNSSAITRQNAYHYDMVRLGIGLYGYDPTNQLNLRTVGTLKTIISQIRTLKKGETVGYSRKGFLEKDSKIAILPIGYADGFLRVFGNGNAQVMINGKHCPTIGNICMDMTMVDITDLDANVNDEAIIFGKNPTISDLAKTAKTIPYEILTNVSTRVKRVFVEE